MQIVIDISEKLYNKMKTYQGLDDTYFAVKHGTVLPKGQWIRMSDLSEQEDDRYKCSNCGNVIHHKNKMDLYTFNSWCGRCGSDNGRKELEG